VFMFVSTYAFPVCCTLFGPGALFLHALARSCALFFLFISGSLVLRESFGAVSMYSGSPSSSYFMSPSLSSMCSTWLITSLFLHGSKTP
jgi:hypothetical protein